MDDEDIDPPEAIKLYRGIFGPPEGDDRDRAGKA